MIFRNLQSRPIAVAAVVSLSISGLFGLGAPAYAADAATPTIIFDGNTLATSVPATEASTRASADSLSISTASLARTTSTTRTGYTFGGWSLTRGGAAATTTITTATTGDTTRTLYAVWNTTINYGTNFADSGTLPSNRISETYRFGQSLVLPTAGTLVKAGYAFGGWMPSTLSANRSTTYTAASDALGNPTLYVAWIKTVTFNANSATSGTNPLPQVFTAGGTALKLPVASEMTLRKPGYEFVGWATTATGRVISNPATYIPLVSQQTLYAVWRIQSTKATSRVFFKPGKSFLRAGQKLALRDLVDTLQGRNAIEISVASRRHSSTKKSLGKQRNTAVVRYLQSLGVQATFSRSNIVGMGKSATAKKNNRVTLSATWTNPTT
jgi:uncharacterized repeat protein (TIGR02543 family)